MRRLWGVLAAMLLAAGCTRINPGHVGIVVHMAGSDRGVQDYAPTTGWVFYNPFSTSVLEYPTFMQTYAYTHSPSEGNAQNEEITFTNKDQMLIAIDVNVSYHIEASKVPEFYVQFRNDNLTQFTYQFLRNTIRDCFNGVAGEYTVEQIMGNNNDFVNSARSCTQSAVRKFGVEIEQFGIIGAPRPPKEVIASIGAKVQAQQLAMQKQNEVLQAEADARKAKATAEGESAALSTRAEGQARATLTNAKAQAEANQILAKSLTPQLIEYTKLNRWDGALPQVTGGGNSWVTLQGRPVKDASADK